MSIQDEIKEIKICCLKKCNEDCCLYEFKNKDGQGLLPRKLNIVYAPNGYGKSSLSQALNILNFNSKRLEIKNKKDFFLLYKQKDECLNKLKIEFKCKLNGNEKVIISDSKNNDILKHFNINIINNNLDVKAKRGYQKGATGEIIIKEIDIIREIPNKIKINKLFDNVKFGELKCYRTKIEKYINEHLNSIEKKFRIFDKYRINQLQQIKKQYSDKEDEFFCLFLIYKTNKSLLLKYIKYIKFKEFEKFIESRINSLKTFDFDIEFKKGVLKFPSNANLISNGQRDVLVFIAKLLKAEWEIRYSNKSYLLIIDEVFDYLDDANLLVAQYFLVNLIKEIGKDRKLFTVLMTHLSPVHFKHFYFNRVKKEFYLMPKPKLNSSIMEIIEKRNKYKRNTPEYNGYSKLLHFNPDNKYIYGDYKYNKVVDELKREYNKYRKILDEGNEKIEYCPISLAIYLRIKIEEYFYKKIKKEEYKNNYINKNNTTNKLMYVEEELNIKVPEVCFLLGTIYNDMAHNESNEFLYYKFNHKVIQGLILEIKNILEGETK